MYKMKYALTVLCVLLCATVIGSASATATAEEVNLTVAYSYSDTPIEGTAVEIYLVADWTSEGFELTAEFQDVEIDFNNPNSPSDWREEGTLVQQYLDEYNCTTTLAQVTDATGYTTFNNLEYGVYYVDVEDMDYEDGTLISSPVLITLPLYTGETNSYTYHVVMEPKVAYQEDPETPEEDTEIPEEDTEVPEEEDTETPEEEDLEVPEEDTEIPEEEDTEVPTTPTTPTTPSTSTKPSGSTDSEVPEEVEVPSNSEEFLDLPDSDIPRDTVDTEEPELPFFLNIFDQPVPLAGTIAWVILPLAIIGGALVLVGLFVLRKKGRKS